MNKPRILIKLKIFSVSAMCVFLAFGSCKKQNTAPSGAVSATVDGVNMDFSKSSNAQLFYDNNLKVYTFYVSGSTSTGTASANILVSIISSVPITKGTYLSSNGDGTHPVQITYRVGSASNHLYISDGFGIIAAVVTITPVTNTNITGTFMGNLTYPPPTLKIVANGKFNVPIDNSGY